MICRLHSCSGNRTNYSGVFAQRITEKLQRELKRDYSVPLWCAQQKRVRMSQTEEHMQGARRYRWVGNVACKAKALKFEIICTSTMLVHPSAVPRWKSLKCINLALCTFCTCCFQRAEEWWFMCRRGLQLFMLVGADRSYSFSNAGACQIVLSLKSALNLFLLVKRYAL